MRKILVTLLLTGIFSISAVEGQVSGSGAGIVLESLFNRLNMNIDDQNRIMINDSIRLILDEYVKSDSVFTSGFPGIRNLGQITDPGSRLKIITWNLVLDESPGRYFCYLVLRKRGSKVNNVYRLSSEYNANAIRTDTTYSDRNWYGALYYDMRPVKKDRNNSWIFLGLDYGNPVKTRKVIEVVTFSPDEILFGRKWFSSAKELKYREVLEYANSAVMSLKFRSGRSVVFDHLVPLSAELKGQKEFYVPDFSFDAYDFEKGLWKFKEDVDVRNKKQK